MSERENLGNILILRCIRNFANNSGVNAMGEILEYDLLLPSAGPSPQKPTAPDIFVCQLHYNTNIDINIGLFGRPRPSQQLRQPEQLGGASQVLPTTFT